MYNKTIKQEYLSSLNLTKKVTISTTAYFNLIEPFEEDKEKDLAFFDLDEILSVYKSINIATVNYLNTLTATYRMYTQYCIDNKIFDCKNNYKDITLDMMSDCVDKELVKKKIINREQLLNICKEISPREAFAMLCLFEGVEGKMYSDILNLKIADFDFENRILHLPDRDIKVSDELIYYAKKANEATITYYYPSMTEMQLFPSPYIIKHTIIARGSTVVPVSGRNLMEAIRKVLKMCGLDEYIAPRNIRESGKIYYIRLRQSETGLSFKELISKKSEVKKIEERFGCKINPRLSLRTYGDHL